MRMRPSRLPRPRLAAARCPRSRPHASQAWGGHGGRVYATAMAAMTLPIRRKLLIVPRRSATDLIGIVGGQPSATSCPRSRGTGVVDGRHFSNAPHILTAGTLADQNGATLAVCNLFERVEWIVSGVPEKWPSQNQRRGITAVEGELFGTAQRIIDLFIDACHAKIVSTKSRFIRWARLGLVLNPI